MTTIRAFASKARPCSQDGDTVAPALPGLRDDPKIVGRDDTKVVGDSVAKAVPFFGNSSPKEAQDCRSELGEGFIASIIGDMFVHYAPASFDRIKMRTIGRDEVQPDPASRLAPATHAPKSRGGRWRCQERRRSISFPNRWLRWRPAVRSSSSRQSSGPPASVSARSPD